VYALRSSLSFILTVDNDLAYDKAPLSAASVPPCRRRAGPLVDCSHFSGPLPFLIPAGVAGAELIHLPDDVCAVEWAR